MPSVDISAQHSKDEKPFFGLDRILQQLLDDPLEEHVIVARMVRSGLTVNDQQGTSRPRIRPLHIEVMVNKVRQKEALSLLEAEYRERTGREDLPPSDLFNSDDRDADDSDGQLEGQTSITDEVGGLAPDNVRPLFASGQSAGDDPTAGPWPGDADYQETK